jgi:hypothetical protein
MAINRTILSVERLDELPDGHPHPAEGRWIIYFQEDGQPNQGAYCFPMMQLTARSIEYGIPINRTDDLLDVVLHELGNPGTMNLPHEHPEHVYRTDERTARDSHMRRLKQSRKELIHDDPNNLLDVLKTAHKTDRTWRNQSKHAEDVQRSRNFHLSQARDPRS